MRIEINPERCQGHLRCMGLADDLFDADDLGYAVVAGDGSVPPDRVGAAELAVTNCPEHAIRIVTGE